MEIAKKKLKSGCNEEFRKKWIKLWEEKDGL
jgi:hypothetical protein